MSSVVISGDTSGAITVLAPAVSGTNTLTLQAGTATNSINTLATAVASTSGTSIDFTGIPSWVKRITVMFNGVSTTGTDDLLVQIGSGSLSTSGYSSAGTSAVSAGVASSSYTAGFGIRKGGASGTSVAFSGVMFLQLITGNTWVASYTLAYTNEAATTYGGGNSPALSGALDRVSVTRTGTNTFDAGSVNILYEG